jgi:hypothetical protein
MTRKLCRALSVCVTLYQAAKVPVLAFTHIAIPIHLMTTTTPLFMTNNESIFTEIPSIEQLEKDSFMKQVIHAEFIVNLFEEDAGKESDVLMKRLKAQLSHADGIRGFMVTYLTMVKEQEQIIPNSLLKAILDQIDAESDTNQLISLMCMNVVMPTAMITMHKNDELLQQSKRTASRALNLIKNVYSKSEEKTKASIMKKCDAILTVARDETNCKSDELEVTYWKDFFQKWGYEQAQKTDIVAAVQEVTQLK